MRFNHGFNAARGLIVASLLVVLSGCESVSFYTQAALGQVEILRNRQSLRSLLADPNTDDTLKARLAYLLEAREFASEVLKLPKNDSYTSYADVGRPYVVWNVVATPKFDVNPVESCFPIAGCVSYRGYFGLAKAKEYARKLQDDGLDVVVGGVSAYSTLGWFSDPILNTMLARSNPELAGLLFHELAHQQFYKKGDTPFNESFATLVEHEGVRLWLSARGELDELQRYESQQADRERVISMILEERTNLSQAYLAATDQPESELQQIKTAAFAQLRRRYRALNTQVFDRWIKSNLNNASLALFSDYYSRVDYFAGLLADADGDWARFYAVVAQSDTEFD